MTDWRPSRPQEALLKAALLQGPEAAAAWEEWRAQTDLDRIDHESLQLLPFLYRALDGKVRDPHMGYYKGIYRSTWARNQVLFHEAAGALDALAGAGVKTLLLKGAAMTAGHYRDPGLRSMMDFDVLVEPRDAARAVSVLESAGWAREALSVPLETAFEERHAIEFRSPEGKALDLHWRALWCRLGPGADDEFWADARPLAFEGRTTLALSPTDQLFHACVHGARIGADYYLHAFPAMLRWVPDALTLCAAPEGIDWDRFVRKAGRFEAGLQLEPALRYLRETFHAPVPAEVLARLEALPATRMARFHRDATMAPDEPRLFRTVFRVWRRYLAWLWRHEGPEAVNRLTHSQLLAGFPDYFKRRICKVESYRQVPLAVLRKVLGRA